MGKMTIQDIAVSLEERNGLSRKESTGFATKMFDLIREALERDKLVKIKGLGTFKIIDVDARESVNVNTGERVLIEGHGKITFMPDVLMKELVNKPFSQFETVVLKDGVDFDDAPAEEPKESPVGDADIDNADLAPLVDFAADEEETIIAPEEEQPVIEITPEPTEVVPQAEVPEDETPVIEAVVEDTPAVEESPAEEEAPVSKEPSKEEPTEGEPAKDEPIENEPIENEPIENEPTEDEPVEDEPTEEVYDEEEPSSDRNRWLLPLVACLAGLLIGYVAGNWYPFSLSKDKAEPKVVAKSDPKPKAAAPAEAKPVAKPDTAVAKPDTTVAKPETAVAKPDTVAAKPVAAAPAPAKELDQYEAKDARVRTGAYRIVGTAQVVKAQAGDDVAKVSRRYFGPGMECYVEVYNGMTAQTELKAGQEIKLPKLELKKKKRPQN